MDRNPGKEDQSASIKKVENHQENQQEPKVAADQSSQPHNSNDGKLKVKLKIPKSDEEIEEGEFVRSPVEKSHICQVCKKGFSSGKALGGHMSSAHVQPDNYKMKKLKTKKSINFKRDGSSCNAAGTSRNPQETLCRICGKDFPSRKSLFGHMRCHPERKYRGMKPPEESSKNFHDPSGYLPDEEDNIDDDNIDTDNDEFQDTDSPVAHQVDSADRVVDLTKCFSSWKVTGKRGREEKKLYDAVNHLISLNNGTAKKLYDAVDHLISLNNTGDTDFIGRIEEDEILDDSSTPSADIKDLNGGIGSRGQSSSSEVNTSREKTDFLVKKRKFFETASADDADSEETLDYGASNLANRKGSIRKEYFTDHEKPSSAHSKTIGLPTGITNDNNNSSAYNHGFKSMKIHDELQNHNSVAVKNRRKAGQKSAKIVNSRTDGEISPPVDDLNMVASTVETPEKFRCSTCGKTFSTHQALGGHRSSHNKLRINIQNVADASSPLNAAEIQANPISQSVENNKVSGGKNGSNVVENVIHQCQTCKKVFSTGQALGGHKRCHRTPGPSASSQVATPEQEESGTSARKVLDFDLNSDPPETEDANGSY